ncbi:MAG: hypothetical protein ACTSX4_14580 [Candidatus Helarchaeota archaeon]
MTLDVGDIAPNFTLLDESENDFVFSQCHEKIMLVFIRGSW